MIRHGVARVTPEGDQNVLLRVVVRRAFWRNRDRHGNAQSTGCPMFKLLGLACDVQVICLSTCEYQDTVYWSIRDKGNDDR